MRDRYTGSPLKDASISNKLEGAELRHNIAVVSARRQRALTRSLEGKCGMRNERRGLVVGRGQLSGLTSQATKCSRQTC